MSLALAAFVVLFVKEERNSYSQLWLKKKKSLNNFVTSVNVPVLHM